MLSLATSRNPRYAKQDILSTLDTAQLLTYYLHEAIQRVVLSKEILFLKKIKSDNFIDGEVNKRMEMYS